MATIQELKERRQKFQDALDGLLLGDRLTSGDSDGMGSASFQTVSPQALEKAIFKIDQQIAKLEGRSLRFCGTPTNIGRG